MPRSSTTGKMSSSGAVSLTWPGRRWAPSRDLENAPENETAANASRSSFALFERFGDPERNSIYWGDAMPVAHHLLASGFRGKVDLVYIDPPFASQADYVHEARIEGPADGAVVRSLAYGDKWDAGGIGSYLDELAPRIEALTKLLSPKGTIWVHLDWRAAYLVRVLLDEILGRDAFINEIVWRRAPNLGRQAASSQFGRTLDTIAVYGGPQAKLVPPTRLEAVDESAIRWDEEGRPFTSAPRGDYTDASIAKLEKEGRVHRTKSGRVYIKYFLVQNPEGIWCRERRVDALWTDVPPLRHVAVSERTGYPTQKPRALLERIISAATRPNDIVVDVFSGSGTTAEAAHELGRRFIIGDASSVAITTSRARLLRRGAEYSLFAAKDMDIVSGAPAKVQVTLENLAERRVKLESKESPVAWAIGTAVGEEPAHPSAMTIQWHSERSLGARPVPVTTEAVVENNGLPLRIRTYGEDGKITTITCHAADDANARTSHSHNQEPREVGASTHDSA